MKYCTMRRLQEEKRCFYRFLTLNIDEGEWSTSRIGCISPGQEPLILIGYQVWTQRQREKSLPLWGIEPRLFGHQPST